MPHSDENCYSKSGSFEWEDSRLPSEAALERLYLIAALALLYSTTQSMAVQIAGLREQVDPHWRRGISYLKIGLRRLQGVFHQGRELLMPIPLLPKDPEPVFASKRSDTKSVEHRLLIRTGKRQKAEGKRQKGE